MKSQINRPKASKTLIKQLVDELSSTDPAEQHAAQDRLSEIGKPAVAELIKSTKQPVAERRREAAWVLGEIRDPSAIPSLIDLLDDEAFEVRWRAAESLIKMERGAVIPIFQALQKRTRFDSLWFLEGVQHVLRKLDIAGYLGPPSQEVLEAFGDPAKKMAIPLAAERALEALTQPK